MRYFLLTCLLCHWLVACAPPVADGTTAGAADSTDLRIAYNVWLPDSLNENNYEVFIMDLDGGNARNLTNHPDVAWTYIASGDRILFISDRDTCYRCFFLYEMDAGGGNLRQVSDIQLRDSWMGVRKGGEEIVVAPAPAVDSLLYLIDRQGKLLQKIATGTPYATDPTFSPDGEWIAFVGSNRPSKRDEGYQAEIYRVRPDGNGLQQLTRYPAADTTAEWYAYKAGPPRWHPSGEFITYQSKQAGKYSLYAVTPDGARQWKLTDSDWQEGWHQWSPDGRYLAIEVFDSSQARFDIALMDWPARELTVLTDSTFQYQQAPVFVTQ